MYCFVGYLFGCKSAKNYKIWLRFHKSSSMEICSFWATLYGKQSLVTAIGSSEFLFQS